jgi:hypothetical protein
LSFNENGDIWILPLDSSGAGHPGAPSPFLQTPAREFGVSLSPDGKWMAYVSLESGKPEVYVLAFPKPGGRRQISVGGGTAAIFSRDGKELFYGRDSLIFVVDVKAGAAFDCSAPRKLFTLPPRVTPTDISLDGTKFLARFWHSRQDSVAHLDLVTSWFEFVKERFAGNK